MFQRVYCMSLFLINPLKLCNYGRWSLQGYVCKSSCCQYHIYNLVWIWKGSEFYPFHWLMTPPQPLSHSATQRLCQSGWRSHSATQPLWVTEATLAERLSGWVAGVKISAIARSICLSSICLPARAQLGKTSFKTNLDRSNMQRFGETSELKKSQFQNKDLHPGVINVN